MSDKDGGEYYCGICRRTFVSADSLWKHLKGASHWREERYKERTAKKKKPRKE